MTRSRAADWLIGALGMLLLLIIAAVVFWWVVSEPATGTNETSSIPVTDTSGPGTPPDDLSKDDIWLEDVDLRSSVVVLPDSSLADVEANGEGARSGPDGVTVDRLEVQATIPFATVAAELGGDTSVSSEEDGTATVERTVEVLGRQIRIVATGTVEVSDGFLVVTPESIDVGGPGTLSRATAAVVRRLVSIEHSIDGLPKNLVLQDVAVQKDGFRAILSGKDVLLAEGES